MTNLLVLQYLRSHIHEFIPLLSAETEKKTFSLVDRCNEALFIFLLNPGMKCKASFYRDVNITF